MYIIQYTLASKSLYRAGFHHSAEFCGRFESIERFKMFAKVEETYNRFVQKWTIVSES